MRVGIHAVSFNYPGAPESIAPTLATAARVAEAARRANTPSLADTTPMPNVGTDGAGESPTTRISSAEKPEKNVDGEARAPTQRTDGHEPDATAAIRTRRQHDPDAT